MLKKQSPSIFTWLSLFVVILCFYMYLLPFLFGEVMLATVDEHCGANTFSNGDAAFSTNEVNTVPPVISLRFGKEGRIGVDTTLEAEGGETTFT